MIKFWISFLPPRPSYSTALLMFAGTPAVSFFSSSARPINSTQSFLRVSTFYLAMPSTTSSDHLDFSKTCHIAPSSLLMTFIRVKVSRTLFLKLSKSVSLSLTKSKIYCLHFTLFAISSAWPSYSVSINFTVGKNFNSDESLYCYKTEA